MTGTNNINQYISAATRENTRRSYQSAIEHFEVTWGGLLPTTANGLADYLAHYAESLSYNTLKQRTVAIGQWHQDQGFPDPSKTPLVKKVLKGIRELHPTQSKQARPLHLEALEQVILHLESHISTEPVDLLRAYRDRALLLIGFWRGFRSDEICRLNFENIETENHGMKVFLPRSKGDRQTQGRYYFTPALQKLCPVNAFKDWMEASGLSKGSVFVGVTRWGSLKQDALHPNSVIPIIRKAFNDAQLLEPESYSSHSLRRGFASWAASNDWSTKELMEYVGWKDVKSAMRYIESNASSNRFLGVF